MLPRFYRFRFINETGQTMTASEGSSIQVRFQPWKFSSGAKVDGTVIVDDMGFTGSDTIADDGEVEGTVNSNTGASDLFVGGHGVFTATPDLDAAVGQCRLYFEHSDDNSSWPSDSDDFVIGDLQQAQVLDIDNSGVDKSRRKNFIL